MLNIRMSQASLSLVGLLVLNLSSGASLANGQQTDDLLKQLKEGSIEQQIAAADKLGSRPELSSESVHALIDALSHANGTLRWHAAQALGDLGERAIPAADALRKALSDEHLPVKVHVARALGQIGDNSDETVDLLTQLVGNENGTLARVAIASLRNLELDPERVVESFSKVLESDQHAVIIHAVEALAERGAAAMPVIVEALKRERAALWACIAIEEIGPEAAAATPHLARLVVESSDPQIRIQALLALASIGDAAAAAGPTLIEFAESAEDLTEKTAAAYAIGTIGAEGASGLLRKMASADDEFLAMIASWALARVDPSSSDAVAQAVGRLTEGLKSDQARMRTAAARGLLELDLPAEAVAPALIQLANDPDPTVVANVVEALASLGEKVAARAGNALNNPELRAVALDVLVRLGPQAKDAIPSMIAVLDESDSTFKADVQVALGGLGAEAAGAVGALINSLSSSDEQVRHSALYALGLIGPEAAEAGGALEAKLESSDAFDKLAAAWALVHIFPENKKFIELAVELLPGGLDHAEEGVRLQIVHTLGMLGEAAKNCLKALEDCAHHDASDLVREAAAEAIERIRG